MSSYYDVGLVLTKTLYLKLNHVSALVEDSPLQDLLQRSVHDVVNEDDSEESHLLRWMNTKWQPDFHKDVKALYAFLNGMDVNTFILIAVNHDYPESDEKDFGNWVDNPFELGRRITSELYWEEA